MGEALRIFLSHSSTDAQLTKSLRDRLMEHAGPELAIEVLVDLQTLKPGQPWPIQLHEMMAYCHAGVLLLTKSAVGSAWVLKEATILAWRAALDPGFRLFVVQLPNVHPEDLYAARFDPVMLDQMQRVLAQDPTDIAKAVVGALAATHATAAPLDTLVSDLSILLKQVAPERLAEIRRRLELPPPPWRPGHDNQLHDAELMARRLLRGEIGSYRGVEELIDDLVRVTATETVEKIFRIVTPYWVPPEAAGCLPALGTGMPQRAAVMVGDCISNYTAQMYIQRAHFGSMLPKMIPIAADSPGDLSNHVTSSICTWYRERTGRKLDDAAVVKELGKPTRMFRYVVVPLLPPADVIKELVQKFPSLRFIFGIDRNPDTDGEAEWICLAVDREMESMQFQAYWEVRDLLTTAL
jgi:hypothetical protein